MSVCSDDMYHLAMVVTDLEAYCRELSRECGVEWSPEIESRLRLWTRGADTLSTVDLRTVYSIRAPHIKVIQAVAGTLLTAVPGRALHHIGYWSDNLAEESNALERNGYPRVMCGMQDDAIYGVAFHQRPDGLLQELVDRRMYADWNGFLNGRPNLGSSVPAQALRMSRNVLSAPRPQFLH